MPRMRKGPRGKDLCSCLQDPEILPKMHKQMESLIVIWKEMLIGWIWYLTARLDTFCAGLQHVSWRDVNNKIALFN